MNTSSTETSQREEFFKKSFRGTFSYNMKVSSVNSFLRSMAQRDLSSHAKDQQAEAKKMHPSAVSSENNSVH